MSSAITGCQVAIRSNDFVAFDLSATITTIGADKKIVLLELDGPLLHAGTTYRYAVAAPRLSKDDLDALVIDGVLGCSVTWVPDGKYNSAEPMDLSWWRGGAAAIADLCIK